MAASSRSQAIYKIFELRKRMFVSFTAFRETLRTLLAGGSEHSSGDQEGNRIGVHAINPVPIPGLKSDAAQLLSRRHDFRIQQRLLRQQTKALDAFMFREFGTAFCD